MKSQSQSGSLDISTSDLINGLKHMSHDHPCCADTLALAAEIIWEIEAQRDSLAEALREMRYGHTDKAEQMAVAALNYLVEKPTVISQPSATQ